jgi:hypothetical protein
MLLALQCNRKEVQALCLYCRYPVRQAERAIIAPKVCKLQQGDSAQIKEYARGYPYRATVVFPPSSCLFADVKVFNTSNMIAKNKFVFT